MEYQTWTRKSNAIAAVKKLLADAPMEYFVMGVDADNVSLEGAAWAVTVEVDNPPSDADALQELLGSAARVKALRSEPVPAEEAPAEEAPAEEAPAEAPRHSTAAERRLTCVEGNNPYQRGASFVAWEWLAMHPGATFAECKAAGVRMRAISHGITMGWIKAE